ncbi:hypothetical protein C7B65_25920 [Phormidesmis priestleyi ULC007]|uniref:Uncharacterized protein n=1 Tax=Phormidesmis priestleyi ULC007 TaxID=1920490 RepID=A0A2T1D2N4_9CYAN|nr:hypothetical protein C7B65_25920 [Phormidesmis priestleyi ULC007]
MKAKLQPIDWLNSDHLVKVDLLKSRYLQASHSAQWESFALNLTRIQTLAESGTDEQVAKHLVRESQLFIE